MDFESVYNPQFLLDVDAAQNYLNELTNAVNDLTSNGNTPDTLAVDFTIPDNPEHHYDREKGTLTITDANGNEHTIELPKKADGTANLPTTIQDKNGTVYNVDENGNITKTNKEEKSEEERPISFTDENILYVTMAGRTDTLMNGHSLTLIKQNMPVKLKVGYKDSPLYNRAYRSIDKSYQKNMIIISGKWNSRIQIDSIQWKSPDRQTTGTTFEFTPSKAGTVKIEIDAQNALPVILRDTLGGMSRDSLIAGKNIEGTKAIITIHVVEGGILRFKPHDDNEYYKDYGFDDAMVDKLQQAGDYGSKIQIANTDYYVPWLGVLPNTEAEIKLEYTSNNPELDSLIVLECDRTEVLLDGNKNRKVFDTFTTEFIKFKVENSAGTYTVKAYSILKGNIKVEIGRLNIESQEYNKKKPKDEAKVKSIRIIRVKRSDEPDYTTFSPTQKAELIENINEYYKQAFITFELDINNYCDSLTITQSSRQLINNPEDISRQLPNMENTKYYIFICSPGINMENGKGFMPGNVHILFNHSSITATHELGHNLGLQHTFENGNDSKDGVCRVGNRILPQSSTTNIMDYSGSPDMRRFFFKYQIDHLKDK
jgi:hypothetical protein